MFQILDNLTQQEGLQTGFAYCIVLVLAIVAGLFLLTKGGDALSDHSSILAKALGVPSVVVGLTIVSIATSAPELFTSIAAIRSSGARIDYRKYHWVQHCQYRAHSRACPHG